MEIYIKDLHLYAFHGVMPQERTVGGEYVLNVNVNVNVNAACVSDDVRDTINYAEVAEIAKAEMAIPSNLLENVAYRIGQAIIRKYPQTESVMVDLRKMTPPMGCDCDGAGIRIHIYNHTNQ